MFNNPYMTNVNQQTFNDRIDNEIERLKQMKVQISQPTQHPAINQTFQLAPSGTTMKFANTIEDVNKEIVYGDTPFFSRDMSVLWVKNVKGEVVPYELTKIIPKDDKDLIIESLQEQLNELKGMMKDVSSTTNVNEEQSSTNTTTNDNQNGTTVENIKSTTVSKVSRSKKE